MSLLLKLDREQKEAVGLLQVGTFLEYFDLMLYVHMAVILNEIFFPKTDPHTAALLSAFAFCSTYVLRPLGALIFGYLGDNIGRKSTVIITTTMMSISCIIMATLPTYAQIGITAAWAVTICRVIQGISSMGEIIGAEIYLTEITKPPLSYPIVSLIGCSSRLGTMVALGVVTMVLTFGIEWRIAFWIGAAIAVVGSVARTRLRETPEFLKIKHLRKNARREVEQHPFKTKVAYFVISSAPPACLYFSYIYFSNILKENGFTGEAIVTHNFILSIIEFIGILFITSLSLKINPLKILKFKSSSYIILALLFPFIMHFTQDYSVICAIQCVSVALTLSAVPAVPLFIKYFPVASRFTCVSFIYALSRAVIYVITSFGLVYLTEWFGHVGASFILLPITIGFLWAVYHFDHLESEPYIPPQTVSA